MSQPLLEQLSSIEILQTATDWLQAECPTYQPDLDALAAKLESGDYCFQPLTTVQKTNKLGESETVEIWENQDRLVLKAMSLVLKDHLSDKLSICCHHLEGRGGIKKAVRKTREFIQNNPESWVLKTDVKGYYAHIDHFVLYNQLQALIPEEKYLLRLCWQYMQRTVYDGGNYYDRERGISLGSPLSPLMAALYLTPLDEEFEGKDWFYARFMDDWIIITPTRWKLRFAVEKVNMILDQHKLTKAYDKTFIGRSQKGFDFLGYHFTPESLTMAKISLQRRDARIHRLYEQGASEHRIGEYVSRWQQWAKAGLQGQLTETEELHNVPRQADSGKLPLEAKFLALGIASVLSTAAFDSHATIYQIGSGDQTTNTPISFSTCDGSNSTTRLRHRDWAIYRNGFTAGIGAVIDINTSSKLFSSTTYELRIAGAGHDPTDAKSLALGSFNANNDIPHVITAICRNCQAQPSIFWMRLDSPRDLSTFNLPSYSFRYGWADTVGEVDADSTENLHDDPPCINMVPSFTLGADQSASPGTNTAQTVNGWATDINEGGTYGQTLSFNVTVSGDSIFTTAPAIDASGNLTYTPNGNSGTATVSVTIQDDGGTADGGVDTSAAQDFIIAVTDVIEPPTINTSSGTPARVLPPELNVIIKFKGEGTVNLDKRICKSEAEECTYSLKVANRYYLKATPASGYEFSHWSGNRDCANGNIFLKETTVCTANFKEKVTINNSGSTGSVISDNFRPINISTRAKIMGGKDNVFAGFILQGAGEQTILIRGVALEDQVDPNITVYKMLTDGVEELATNDDWQDDDNASEIPERLKPSKDTDAGLLMTLEAGIYTIILGSNADKGIANVSVNLIADENGNYANDLINLSTRASIQGGADDVIAGFIVNGNGTQKVLITARALDEGVNPTLKLQKYPSGDAVAENDNWQDADNSANITRPLNDNDAAILLDLPAGAYTAIMSSAGEKGVGIVGVNIVQE